MEATRGNALNLSVQVSDVSKIYRLADTQSPLSLLQALKSKQESSNAERYKVAVDRVSFSIQTGDRLGIVGANGAGKSTLLQMITGVSKPSSGNIEVVGHVTAVLTLGVGLREDLSGRENIYIDGEVQGKSRTEISHIIEEIIEFAELGEFIDYPVRTYSTGMKSRLAFSMLVCIEPEILIIDEALSAGDSIFAAKASQKIREICNKGKIVILVSHSMATIVEMCDRCIWIDQGQIVMDGDPQEVTSAYLEDVRKADEALLIEKYSSYIKAVSWQQGCKVISVEAYYAQESEPRTILIAEQDVILKLRLQVDVPLNDPDIRLQIARLDGMVFSDLLLSETDPEFINTNSSRAHSDDRSRKLYGCIAYDICMTPLVLGKGKYVVTCELLNREIPIAAKSTIIEVLAPPNAPTGGQPALFYPCTINLA